MKLRNESQFPLLAFESFGETNKPISVVFCRGTFAIKHGSELIETPVQDQLVLADRYRAQPLESSIRIDTDLVPTKLAADITLNTVARPSHGRPLGRWPVAVRVGRISKTLIATGERQWQYSLLRGWRLTDPRPTTEVPIHYELAFGGTYRDSQRQVAYERNPIGRGFVNVRTADCREPIPAPQIEALDAPIDELGQEYEPAGFGPIAKHWLPRRALCGTADDRWKATRWPMRPADFDFRYYNSAPTGLVYPEFLRGDEEVLLTGVAPDGPIHFALPGISLTLFALTIDHEIILEEMKLDTLHIDTTTMTCGLTWRMAVPRTSDLDTVQIVRSRLTSALAIH